MDHDARFKMLLEAPAILRGFFDAFLSEVARFIDFKIRNSRFEISNPQSRISNLELSFPISNLESSSPISNFEFA